MISDAMVESVFFSSGSRLCVCDMLTGKALCAGLGRGPMEEREEDRNEGVKRAVRVTNSRIVEPGLN